MPDSTAWIHALRNSQDRLTGLLSDLDDQTIRSQSYDDEWSIADVASHLGSQAEIFDLFINAGVSGAQPPGNDVFPAIWERWNALPPSEQVAQALAANAALISRLEQMSPEQAERFSIPMFGAQRGLSDVVAMRLSEHAVHTWDIAVALDPAATISVDAVGLLIDMVGQYAGRGRPGERIEPVLVVTTDPPRTFRLSVDPGAVSLTPVSDPAGDDPTGSGANPLRLPAEAFIRLLYGRLDDDHSPREVKDDPRIPGLRRVFPGF